MSALPARFPRASLVQHAAFLESRIARLVDETWATISNTPAKPTSPQLRKLQERYEILEKARDQANKIRMTLWELP